MITRTVGLRSDTVTKPTETMRAAMTTADFDDDVLGYDPTALCLETEMARRQHYSFPQARWETSLVCLFIETLEWVK
jgi:hypothetical protein